MRNEKLFAWVVAGALVLGATAASAADTPFQFVRSCHARIESILKQPPSPKRDAELMAAVDDMIDYDELIRDCFKEHWDELDKSKRLAVTDLLTRIIRMSYERRVTRTLDYDVKFEGVHLDGARALVRTHATSARDPRAPAVEIDYVVEGPSKGRFHVIDVRTEGSSLATSYYREFHRFLTTPGEGYPFVVQKLKDKVAHLEAEAAE